MPDTSILATEETSPQPSNDGSWENNLTEETRKNSHISRFTSNEALAKAYISANEQLSKNHPGPTPEDSWETFEKKVSNFFKIPSKQEEYGKELGEEVTKDVKDLGYKYKIHPKQLKPLAEALKKNHEKDTKREVNERVEGWSKRTEELFKDVEGKDEIIGRAYKRAGFTRESFEKELGGFAKHDVVNKLLLTLGRLEVASPKKEGAPQGTQGKEGEDVGIKDKLAYLQKMRRDPNSPFRNTQHPEHFEVKNRVNEWAKDLTEYQRANPDSDEARNMSIL